MARRRRPRRSRFGLAGTLLLLVALGVVQYLETGSLRWPDGWQALLGELLPEAGSPATASRPAPDQLLQGLAVNITDGDTFTLRYGSTEEERVRLHGIDAPERDQPHGRAAGAALAALIEGHSVRVQLVDRDNYGRLVARIWRDEVEVNLAMVRDGHAWWYAQYARDRTDLELAQAEARRAGLGLWAAASPVAPWDWRRGRR